MVTVISPISPATLVYWLCYLRSQGGIVLDTLYCQTQLWIGEYKENMLTHKQITVAKTVQSWRWTYFDLRYYLIRF